jgi:hypothetical protein
VADLGYFVNKSDRKMAKNDDGIKEGESEIKLKGK